MRFGIVRGDRVGAFERRNGVLKTHQVEQCMSEAIMRRRRPGLRRHGLIGNAKGLFVSIELTKDDPTIVQCEEVVRL